LTQPAWKPAFLIHGDDHGRVGERRASLRQLAEDGGGAIEVYEGEEAAPDAVANALCAMTFAMGRRFLIVDGVERWKDAEVEEHLKPVLAAMPPETTVAFFGRDEGKAKTSEVLAAAVKAAGGAVATEDTLKLKDLPAWAVKEAQRLGFELDGNAARALVESVGERRPRLQRELEKLAVEHGPGARIETEEIEGAVAHSAEHQVWGLLDAVMAHDRPTAIRRLVELDAQGESLARLIPLLARRLREVESVAARIEAGEPPAQIKSSIRPPWVADRRLREARGADVEDLRGAIVALSDLELASRGLADASEDTVALRTIASISG
jgi:DNA polymerase-3 subunit delta